MMANYEITPSDAGVAIQITGVGVKGQELLAAFGDCQQGQCSCPTDEYRKVETMEVTSSQDAISIRLQAKPGTELDTREIGACLDYTIDKTGR